MVNLTMRAVAALGLLVVLLLSSAMAQEKKDEKVETLLHGSEWELTIHVPAEVFYKAAAGDEKKKKAIDDFLKGQKTAPLPGKLTFKKDKEALVMVQTHPGQKPAERQLTDVKVEKLTATFKSVHRTDVEKALNEPTAWKLSFVGKDGKFVTATGRLTNSAMDAEVTLKRAASADKPKEKGKK